MFDSQACDFVKPVTEEHLLLSSAVVGSNGGPGSSSGGRQLPDGDGEVEDDASCACQQEDHLA